MEVLAEVDLRMGVRGRGAGFGCSPSLFFAIPCFICSHFEELKTVLSEVELIINYPHLTYVYANSIEICLTPNHLLFGRQLLYSSNTKSTDKINCISNHFWIGEDMNNVENLRETQQTSKLNINSQKTNVNDIVLVYDEVVPRNVWRIAIVTGVLPSKDSEIREAMVRMAKTNAILKRPVNKLFTVKNTYHDTNQTDKARE